MRLNEKCHFYGIMQKITRSKVKGKIVRGTRDKSTNQSDFLIIRVSSNRDFLFALSSSFLRCILKIQIVTGFLHLFQNPYLFVTTMQIFA